MDLRRTVDNLSTESTPNLDATGNISQEASQAPLEESREEIPEIRSEPIITSSPEIPANVDTTPVQEQPVRPSSGRRRRRHAADSDLEVRNLIDARVLQFLNQNRSHSLEERTIRSLASSLARVPEERQTRCLSSLCLLIDLYRHSEPFEIVHRMELLRDQQLNIETPERVLTVHWYDILDQGQVTQDIGTDFSLCYLEQIYNE
ncbi:uncharacterized protein LOC120993733 [Bufo bufo]|uniref:uncharacterized protein LOC120993733 n=1 Tax=Bufo bufo TaxID=8384 RepID=UPI001ABE2BD4|nr:uncharacterized protein LOC120993733 [Bufo bufo]